MSNDSVPYLRSGTGATPKDGGCVLQIVDWITRHQWTDEPPCVHPVLRKLAIRANDALDDPRRQALLDLIPRLMHTATKDRRVSVGLAVYCARAVLPLYEARYPGDLRPRRAIEAAESGADAARAAVYAAYAAAAAAGAAAAVAADAAAYAAYAAYADAARAAAYAADAAGAAAAAAAPGPLALLLGCLDEYDRLTGHTVAVPTPDYAPVCAVMRGETR